MGEAAAITLLTNALKVLAPNPSTTLIPPTFDWNSTEQYSDFQLFPKSVKSWFTLQNIVREEKQDSTEVDSTRLEYLLNFLGNIGHKKYERWQQSGTKDEAKKAKASVSFLQWTMKCHSVAKSINWKMLEYKQENHPTSLWNACVPQLSCNFPTNDEKEHNVLYCFVHALSDKDLVKKLLTLDLKATTAKMLKVCQTHITISNNLDAIGLVGSKPVHAIHQGKHNKQHKHGLKQPGNHQCGNCMKSHLPGQASCPAKDSTCNKCGKVGHWKPRCCGGEPKKQQPNKS